MSFYIGSNKITPALLNQKSSGGIENTATGTDSLTILGTPATSDWSVNIGVNSEANGGQYEGCTAIGYNTIAGSGSVAVGSYNDDTGYSTTAGVGSIAIGVAAIADSEGSGVNESSIAIGSGAESKIGSISIGGYGTSGQSTVIGVMGASDSGYSVALGYMAKIDYNSLGSIALGYNSHVTGGSSIALGYEAQSTSDCEFVVGGLDSPSDGNNVSYKMLDLTTGKIPNDRINGVSGSFTSADGKTITVTNGVITSIV